MDIEYEGTDWHGWQSQPDDRTIQGEIESAMATVLREKVSITGSGRTDAGVHARGQVAHFSTRDDVDTYKLLGSINGIVSNSIAIRKLVPTHESFHARYDARSRLYRFRICTVPIALERAFHWYLSPLPDIDAMNRAAALILGEHNFSGFCRANSETKNRVCDVTTATWIHGPYPDTWIFEIAANRFLHGMVRAIVGTLIEIGQHKRSEDDIVRILESEDRTLAGFSAPALGLTLERVSY